MSCGLAWCVCAEQGLIKRTRVYVCSHYRLSSGYHVLPALHATTVTEVPDCYKVLKAGPLLHQKRWCH
eukprot:scaffold91417_cov16-Tisochrysis_lutea.AAC.1